VLFSASSFHSDEGKFRFYAVLCRKFTKIFVLEATYLLPPYIKR